MKIYVTIQIEVPVWVDCPLNRLDQKFLAQAVNDEINEKGLILHSFDSIDPDQITHFVDENFENVTSFA